MDQPDNAELAISVRNNRSTLDPNNRMARKSKIITWQIDWV